MPKSKVRTFKFLVDIAKLLSKICIYLQAPPTVYESVFSSTFNKGFADIRVSKVLIFIVR